jgi:hypothetical protein
VKRCIAALAVALLAFPVTASAVTDLRESQQVPSSSLGVPPHLATHDRPTAADVPQFHPAQAAEAVQARGTDVAAPDQQASKPAPAPVTEAEPGSGDFDWADAGIGAATAASLLGISLAGGIAIRRRQQRRPSALAG